MGNSLRNQPFPSLFHELRITPTINVQDARIYFYFSMVAISFLLILPGVRGKERCWMFLHLTAAIWIGAVLIICNYSAWYGGSICTRTQYKAHTNKNTPQIIQAEVGLYIGLRGINITLMEKNCLSLSYVSPFPDELISYNERFSWSDSWSQGRQDFSKYGGRFKQEYRAAKYRGLPYPITWVAEHFILDGEQIRWYRKFRQAGWYTHAIMWLAFATHLLSILFFMSNIRMGAWQMATTGSLMMIACLVYRVIIICDPILEVHFPDRILSPHFKYAFWLTLATGIATFLVACLILIFERMNPRKVAIFFHHSITQDDSMFEYDEEYETFHDKFGKVSIRRLTRNSNGSSRNGTIKRPKRSKKESKQKSSGKEQFKRPSNCTPENDRENAVAPDSRPGSVTYSFPEITAVSQPVNVELLHPILENGSTCTPQEIEMEIQIAEITIHTED